MDNDDDIIDYGNNGSFYNELETQNFYLYATVESLAPFQISIYRDGTSW